MRKIIMLAAVLSAAACGERAPEQDNTGVAQTYVPELQVDLTTMTRSQTGLYMEDLTVGAGAEAQNGSMVTVHYTGWLPTGEEFDSSRSGAPISFPLGTGAVVPGWEEGLLGMRAGGRRKLVIPSHLAYGAQGYGEIPPYATLVFDVEMVAVGGDPAVPDTTSQDTVPADSVPADTTSHDH